MQLVSLTAAALSFGDHALLDGIDLKIDAGERIGLIGRNGTGKSTLLRVVSGQIVVDDGRRQQKNGLRIVQVDQEPVLLDRPTLGESLHAQIENFEHADERQAWRQLSRLTEFMTRFGLDAERQPATMSGGERKRAALAFAFAVEPELLLLDEPTNHLDIEGIEQLETLVCEVPALLVITHDRAFLDRVTTRIVELDRGQLRSYPAPFAAYEARKAEELAAELLATRRFDTMHAQEEVWIRQGVEARRTRNEGRVRRLEKLREARAARRERTGQVRFTIDDSERSSKLIAELTSVSKRFGDQTIVDNLSLRIVRGDRVAVIGPNGAGKSTLIRLILKQIEPDSGTIRLAQNVQIAYFDQLREQLDPNRTVAETISPGSDWIEIGDSRQHVMSYLGDFLFPPQRARSPVKMLSGGERNRLLLARLFARPANLLVLDEPTNDLDIETLDLLESLLQEYAGTLLLVSHDRRFLDNIVTQTIVAEGPGIWREYVGGYTDWLRQRALPSSAANEAAPPAPGKQTKGRRKLSFKEERELASLPGEIERLEREQSELHQRMSTPDYHRESSETMRADATRTAELETLMAERFARWESLETERLRRSATA